ncbi:hypothetical protein LOTGIDRAFT_166906 [Lottia gigantea]|uniref:Uncharacterized protein n=1 Tax=Lottia gigantea TaxID=225164 RepID=V3ZQL5_LOTGI|nr:hypothetical protein LOTGIDRAFT_166906 [Lottia gigantea]ESO86637.1 hypothetical protein LOTGIDRAFT_166906 [Lottia gigantea]
MTERRTHSNQHFMLIILQVLFTSDDSGQLWNSCVWDFSTGTGLMQYRGGSSGAHSLSLLGNDYLIGGGGQKSVVNVWELQRKDQNQIKIILPGKVNCLCPSPDGNYCIVGIAEKIYIWQTSSGNLLKVISRHYLDVTCIRFTDDGSHFITAGDDNLVIAWCLPRTISSTDFPLSKPEPKYVWTGHSLPVKDVYVGSGGVRSRVISSSLDQTCKLWDMTTGELLCTFIFDDPIMSVYMDSAEFRIFAGSNTGHIYCVNLYGAKLQKERHITNKSDDEGISIYKGHSSKINCLSMSMDGSILASGSADCTVKLWDVYSGQCIRTLDHKGSVTNAFITSTPSNILNPDSKPFLVVQHFKRHLHSTQQQLEGDNSNQTDLIHMKIRGCKRKSERTSNTDINNLIQSNVSVVNQSDVDVIEAHEELNKLKSKISKLKNVNKELYDYAVTNIVNKV